MDRWLTEDAYKAWIQKVPSNKFGFKCIACQKSMDLNTMGEFALKRHAAGKSYLFSQCVCVLRLGRKKVPKRVAAQSDFILN